MKYFGHCHCNAVQFEIESDLNTPMQCNCSFCIRRGTTVHMDDVKSFKLLKGKDEMTRYGSKPISDHFFCKTCGISPFTYLKDQGNVVGVSVNIACLDGVDITQMKSIMVDGKSF